MACTYGESWALFHSDTIAPALGHQYFPSASSASSVDQLAAYFDPGLTSSSALTTSTRPSPQSRSSDSPALPDHTILAEIQRLRQELSEIKRSQPSNPAQDQTESLQNTQQPSASSSTTGVPSNAPPPGPRRNNSSTNTNANNLPRCWDPCCNGRTFSNPSNLARHQREKRGEAAKLRCSFCDAVFSRSAARNAHEAEKRCRNNNANNNNNNNDPNSDDGK